MDGLVQSTDNAGTGESRDKCRFRNRTPLMRVLPHMLTTKGRLYTDGRKIVANLGWDFGNYYFSLMPKYLNACRQKFEAHVTIVRSFEKATINKSYKGVIAIDYEPMVYYDKPYYFLKCWSDEIGEIRNEVGLAKYRKPFDYYHITIANTKFERKD